MKALWPSWKSVKDRLAAKELLLFLDFDGTLAPIVSKPELARIPQETLDLLKTLSETGSCKIAIISGRELSDVKQKIGLKNILYAGNHGLELEGPRLRHTFFEFAEFRAILDKVKSDLEYVVSTFKGSFIEDKGLTLSLHFRLVPPEKLIALRSAVRETLIHYSVKNLLRVKKGKMVFEIRPPVNWDKGKVVLWLLARWKFALADKKAIPVYIGDDTTDEDAFTALKGKGVTIVVGKPEQTAAQFYINSQGEINRLLSSIAELKKTNSHG
ncbi:MAG: trehalose-phosphatase [Candidatus Omnitrophota bacterium]